MKIPTELFRSIDFRAMQSDAIQVCFVMLADFLERRDESVTIARYKEDGKAVTDISVQTIAERVGVPELSVFRYLDVLCQRGWVKKIRNGRVLFELGAMGDFGFKWHLESAIKTERRRKAQIEKSVLEGTRVETKNKSPELAARQKVAIAEQAGRSTGVNGRVLLGFFHQVFSRKFGRDYPMHGKTAHAKFGAMWKRFIVTSGWPEDKLKQYIEFAVENWERVAEAIGVQAVEPTVNLLVAHAWWTKIAYVMENGFEAKTSKSTKRAQSKRYEGERQPIEW